MTLRDDVNAATQTTKNTVKRTLFFVSKLPDELQVFLEVCKLHAGLDVCLSVHRCICVDKKTQLDVTEWFIALIIYSTCFGHLHAHHQELETICVLLPSMVCSAWLLVVGGRCRSAGYESR